MAMLERIQPLRSRKERRYLVTTATHEFLTHDQRHGDADELEFDDLDERERMIFLRCGFRAPQAA